MTAQSVPDFGSEEYRYSPPLPDYNRPGNRPATAIPISSAIDRKVRENGDKYGEWTYEEDDDE
jgi:hypothetical protein